MDVVLFKKNIPTSCWLDQLYDPDVDGSNPQASGKYILEPASIVVDRDTGTAYYVVSVDSRYKHKLLPLKFVVVDESKNVQIISYGNSLYYLYYDDRVRPTQLTVDRKLAFFGEDIAEYRLLRKNVSTQDYEHISLYVDSDNIPRGDRIPLVPLSQLPTVKIPTNSHTTHELQDGDSVLMQLFDTAGMLIAEVTLFARRATILNDLAADAVPILELNAEASQVRGEDYFLYTGQNPDELNIRPYLLYADGTKQYLDVDNYKTFIHGLEDITTSFPGFKQPIVIKYHLNPREVTVDNFSANRDRVMSVVKNIVIIPNMTKFYAQASIIPVWDRNTRSYKPEYYLYTEKRDRIYRVTDIVEYIDNTTFNGYVFGREQKVTIRLDLKEIYNSLDPVIHIQTFYITLKDYSSYERYIIKRYKNDTYAYGVDVTTYRRPVIHYDPDLGKYFIPSTIFQSKDAFLEVFYYFSRPMYDPSVETGPMIPTHFTVRTPDTGQMVIIEPIPITQYEQAWSLAVAGLADQLVGTTVMVEFIKEINPTTRLLLQSVPVDVYNSIDLVRGGYNTNTNNNLYGS